MQDASATCRLQGSTMQCALIPVLLAVLMQGDIQVAHGRWQEWWQVSC